MTKLPRDISALLVAFSLAVFVGPSASGVEIWRSAMDGNANDEIGTNHGVATGTIVATEDRDGNAGAAALFDGLSYFEIPNTGSAGTLGTTFTAGSVALWVRVDDTAAGADTSQTGPLAMGSSGGGTTQYFTLLNTNENVSDNDDHNGGGWRLDFDGGGSGAGNIGRVDALTNGDGLDGEGYTVNPTNGNTGVWQHLTATFATGGEMRLYVNGVLQDEVVNLTSATAISPTNAWVIGSERAGVRDMIGSIDDLHIYDHELTQGEIDALAHLIPGDVNNDGTATIEDFNIIRDNFGDDVFLRRLGDLNHDRVVDFDDFNEWKASVPSEVAALASFAEVPEPATAALMLVAAAGLSARRRTSSQCRNG